jgi:hypothetical protein
VESARGSAENTKFGEMSNNPFGLMGITAEIKNDEIYATNFEFRVNITLDCIDFHGLFTRKSQRSAIILQDSEIRNPLNAQAELNDPRTTWARQPVQVVYGVGAEA